MSAAVSLEDLNAPIRQQPAMANNHHEKNLSEPTIKPLGKGSRVSTLMGSLGEQNKNAYFIGPRNLHQHSKWPIFLRLHGSVAPEMVLPLLFTAAWATLITCISKFVHNLGINNLLLTVLGFVVGLALSFRSSTAYERYNDGRKYWAQVSNVTQNLARLVWVHGDERDGELGKQDLLAKLTFINLLCAFSVSLKHKLRFEPFTHYEDLNPLLGHIDTYARNADVPPEPKKQSTFMGWMEYLGVPMAEQNPRSLIKNPTKPLGNLPLEILTHLAAFEKRVFENGTLKAPIYQTTAMNSLLSLNEAMTGCERVLNTPLPIAYSIAIGQITWVYILLLPFQLYRTLEWVTIPGTIFAAYIILGIALIGREIENPFGVDVNDLPLDDFCNQIRIDCDIITSQKAPKPDDFIQQSANSLLYPLSNLGYQAWDDKSEEDIRKALRQKPDLAVRKDE